MRISNGMSMVCQWYVSGKLAQAGTQALVGTQSLHCFRFDVWLSVSHSTHSE